MTTSTPTAPASPDAANGSTFRQRWLLSPAVAWRAARVSLAAVCYSALAALLIAAAHLPTYEAGAELTASLGVVLGILIVFRNNTANDRWWEARKLWGQLVNDSRNLALKVRAFVPLDTAARRRFADLLVAFARELRDHLHGAPVDGETPSGMEIPAGMHRPGYVAGLLQDELGRWYRGGGMAGPLALICEEHARGLMDVCGACERIKNTPLARSYKALAREGIALYVLAAPWSLSLDLGVWSLPPLAVGIYFLVALELTAEAIEDPFGVEDDDLPLERYCQSIESFVQQALSESPH